MYENYYENYYDANIPSELSLYIFLIIMMVLFVTIAITITIYILYSVGLYKMAKKLGISSPWMAFFPILSNFLLGKIAESPLLGPKSIKYSYFLLFFELAVVFIGIILLPLSIFVGALLHLYPIIVLVYFLYYAAAITVNVFVYIALYRLFKIFSPDNAVVFTILSIFFSIAMPFIVFFIRNKDPKPSYVGVGGIQGNGYWNNAQMSGQPGYYPGSAQNVPPVNGPVWTPPAENVPQEQENESAEKAPEITENMPEANENNTENTENTEN